MESGRHGLFEGNPNWWHAKNCIVARGVLTGENKFNVPVMNLSNKPVTIIAGEVIGTVVEEENHVMAMDWSDPLSNRSCGPIFQIIFEIE